MTYQQIIMQKLLNGETISPISALNDFGCFSLSQRISELRARGEPIQGRLVTTANGKRHNIYWIEPKDIERIYQELGKYEQNVQF